MPKLGQNSYGNNRMMEFDGKAALNATARKEVVSNGMAEVDTYLLANGYTAAKLKSLTTNDKIYALRKKRGIKR